MSKIDNFPRSPPKTGLKKRKELPPYQDERFKSVNISILRALVEFKKTPVYEMIFTYFKGCVRGLENDLMGQYRNMNFREPSNGQDGVLTKLAAQYSGRILGMEEFVNYLKGAKDELDYRLRREREHGSVAAKALSGEQTR